MRNTRKLLLPGCVAAFVSGALFPTQSIAADSAGGINAALLYHNYCSVCHGDRGDGNSRAKNSLVPPPRNFTVGELPRDYMIAITANGKPGTAMVGWKTQLNSNEVAAVVDYIRESFMAGGAALAGPKGLSGISAHGGRERDSGAATAPPTGQAVKATSKADMGLQFPFDLKGNRDKGEKFYMANCATCHGAKGDGKGPRAYFINPKPRNFLEDAPRAMLNRPTLYAAIAMGSLGTEMPAWNKVLNEQEMADVAEYVFQAYIQPAAKSAGKTR